MRMDEFDKFLHYADNLAHEIFPPARPFTDSKTVKLTDNCTVNCLDDPWFSAFENVRQLYILNESAMLDLFNKRCEFHFAISDKWKKQTHSENIELNCI